MKKELSVRAGVVLQLAIVAIASLSFLAVFSLKVVEVSVERRHAEAAVSVAGMLRTAVRAQSGGGEDSSAIAARIAGQIPYIGAVDFLPEGEGPDSVQVTPVGDPVSHVLKVHSAVDVVLPPEGNGPGESSPAASPGERGDRRALRVRVFSPGVEEDTRKLVRVTTLLLAVDTVVFVVFGFLLVDRSVVRPLRRLAATSEKIASGDLRLRADETPANEVGQLGASFNRMVVAMLSAQEKARQFQQETFRSEKLATVGRLAAGVAHEVGNPLAGIRGYADYLLRNRPPPEERDECLGKIVAETKRIENIVRGLLSVASSEREGGAAVDVDDVLRKTVDLLSFRKMFRDIEVIVETGGPGKARIPEERFRQVLLNLMINAVDAMERGGRLAVRTFPVRPWIPPGMRRARRRASDPPEADMMRLRAGVADLPGTAIAVSVSDTGCGIPPDELPMIFDPFFTTKEAGRGTGLGLSVSRAIVEAAGGEIAVESGEGKGSTFTVILPEAGADERKGGEDGRSHG